MLVLMNALKVFFAVKSSSSEINESVHAMFRRICSNLHADSHEANLQITWKFSEVSFGLTISTWMLFHLQFKLFPLVCVDCTSDCLDPFGLLRLLRTFNRLQFFNYLLRLAKVFQWQSSVVSFIHCFMFVCTKPSLTSIHLLVRGFSCRSNVLSTNPFHVIPTFSLPLKVISCLRQL